MLSNHKVEGSRSQWSSHAKPRPHWLSRNNLPLKILLCLKSWCILWSWKFSTHFCLESSIPSLPRRNSTFSQLDNVETDSEVDKMGLNTAASFLLGWELMRYLLFKEEIQFLQGKNVTIISTRMFMNVLWTEVSLALFCIYEISKSEMFPGAEVRVGRIRIWRHASKSFIEATRILTPVSIQHGKLCTP